MTLTFIEECNLSLNTVLDCKMYNQITVGNVTLPKAVLSTVKIFAVYRWRGLFVRQMAGRWRLPRECLSKSLCSCQYSKVESSILARLERFDFLSPDQFSELTFLLTFSATVLWNWCFWKEWVLGTEGWGRFKPRLKNQSWDYFYIKLDMFEVQNHHELKS